MNPFKNTSRIPTILNLCFVLVIFSCSTKSANDEVRDFSNWYGNYDYGNHDVLRITKMLGYDLPYAFVVTGKETKSIEVTLSVDGYLLLNGNQAELKDEAIVCSIESNGSVQQFTYPRINQAQVDQTVETKKKNILVENTVTIGDQIWMANDLNLTQYSNGDPIQEAKSPEEWQACNEKKVGCWCFFNNDKNQNVLYNWYAVIDNRGLSPSGWKIPSLDDYMTLANFLGGEGDAGIQMKASGFHSSRDNDGSLNSSGFSAVGAGYREQGWPGEFRGKTSNGVAGVVFYWAISIDPDQLNNLHPRTIGLYVDSRRLHKDPNAASITSGLSVRCIKN